MLIDVEFWLIFIALFTGLTYLVWGFVVAFEVVLGMGGSRFALRWIKAHHTYKYLYVEVLVFYPMILLGYLFLELVPHLFFGARLSPFDMDGLFERLFGGNSDV